MSTMQNRYELTDFLFVGKVFLQFNLLFDSIWGPINVVTFNTVVFMLTMAHLKAVLSDPGKVPLPQSRLDFSDLHSLQTSKKTDMEREEWTVSFYFIQFPLSSTLSCKAEQWVDSYYSMPVFPSPCSRLLRKFKPFIVQRFARDAKHIDRRELIIVAYANGAFENWITIGECNNIEYMKQTLPLFH